MVDRHAGVEVRAGLAEILAERLIQPLYQPIVDIDTRMVVGLEALARGPAGSGLEFPEQLFAAARAAGRLGELDMLCAERALECAIDAGERPPLLFVNAEPAVLDQPLSPRLIELVCAGLPFREVLEFTERALPTVPGSMLRLAALTRAFGHSIALDDVGVEPMSLAFLPILEPEIIKLDMGLIREPDVATTVQVSTVVRAQARRTGAVVIAEGVETARDLEVARSLGARWGQGFLFGRPGPIGGTRHRYDAGAGVALPAPHSSYQEPVTTPFVVAAAHGPVVAGDETSVADRLGRLCGVVAADPDVIVIAGEPDGSVPGITIPMHAMFGGARSLIIRDRPVRDEFAVAVLGAGYGRSLCVRSAPRVEVSWLDDLPAVAAVARNLLGTAPDPGRDREP